MQTIPSWLFTLIIVSGTFGGAWLYDYDYHVLGSVLACGTLLWGFAVIWLHRRYAPRQLKPPLDGGTWAEDDLRRAFVRGAKWWEYHQTHATMWDGDRALAEAEAERRYPGGAVREDRWQ